MTIRPAGTTGDWLAAGDVDSDAWWLKIATAGTPLVERQPDDERLKLIFFWRDPGGNETTSAFQRVYLDINGVTDHHSFTPKSLERVPGTAVWCGTVLVEPDWRGSYSLIPITGAQLPPQPQGDAEQQHQQQREWWCSLFPCAIADPLNPNMPLDGVLSAIHLPQALSQQAWRDVDAGLSSLPADDLAFEWHSARLGNRRRVWLWQPEAGEDMPLIILLDGQKWVKTLSLLPVLEAQTRLGGLPAAVWLMIDAVDNDVRSRELTCNADFWLAVQEELLPLARQRAAFTDDPARTLVAGQSYGGLSALYAALFWPQRFGCVLTQSGSFWWPNMRFMTHFAERESHEPGFLTQQVARHPDAVPLRIFQEAGLREQDIHFVNQQMYQALIAAGHQVNYRSYQGGHDALCWRGGLIDGVRWLLEADAAEPSLPPLRLRKSDEPAT
ncbi:enterochelin esterase [Mixta intestinalis]|uniref:Enterochelin esterase n=1 Tax=Mixta intestinalis TaxID=1615494 RepID=A0A6P1Q1Q7_9GAMM|nr:enterochelin esterase [Mixta intestinalis]QHM71775.1 Enterochelin esterase [Mixta intestinalis]